MGKPIFYSPVYLLTKALSFMPDYAVFIYVFVRIESTCAITVRSMYCSKFFFYFFILFC